MEMEYEDGRRRGKLVIIVGVALAVVVGVASFFLINQAQEQAGQGDLRKTSVVVAVQVIPARRAITADDVAIREVPIDPTNAAGIATNVADVIGRIPAVTILQGQLVTLNMLASTAAGAPFSILGPNETVSPDSEPWRAVSITVSDDLAVGGLLQAGQTVDIFVTVAVNVPLDLAALGQYYTDRSTKIVYQDVLLLAREDAFYVIRPSARPRSASRCGPTSMLARSMPRRSARRPTGSSPSTASRSRRRTRWASGRSRRCPRFPPRPRSRPPPRRRDPVRADHTSDGVSTKGPPGSYIERRP
jgi:Flp pilus assembly protein CpaB